MGTDAVGTMLTGLGTTVDDRDTLLANLDGDDVVQNLNLLNYQNQVMMKVTLISNEITVEQNQKKKPVDDMANVR